MVDCLKGISIPVSPDSRCMKAAEAESKQQKSAVCVFHVPAHTRTVGGGVSEFAAKNLQAGFKDPGLQSACDRLCENERKRREGERGLTLVYEWLIKKVRSECRVWRRGLAPPERGLQSWPGVGAEGGTRARRRRRRRKRYWKRCCWWREELEPESRSRNQPNMKTDDGFLHTNPTNTTFPGRKWTETWRREPACPPRTQRWTDMIWALTRPSAGSCGADGGVELAD